MTTKFHRVFLLIVILIASGCSALSSNGAESTIGSEAGLFDDGPVGLPVTIAKLESHDAQYTTMSVSEATSSSQFLATPDSSSDNTATNSYRCTITGEGSDEEDQRAVHDPSATPYTLAYNSNDDTYATVRNGSDGSFSLSIGCDIDESILLFTVTNQSLVSATGSYPLGVSFDIPEGATEEDSDSDTVPATIIFTKTNSSRINDSQPFASDPYGNILFSTAEDDGTFTLLRINVDGSDPDIVLENHPTEPLVVAAMADMSDTSVDDVDPTVVVMDRGVDLTKITEDTSVDPSLFESELLADSIGSISSDENNAQTQRFNMLPIDFDKVLVVRPDDEDSTHVLEVYWTDGSGTVATVLGTTYDNENLNYEKMVVEFNHPNHTFVAVRSADETTSTLYTIDLSPNANDEASRTIYETAWENKTPLISNFPYEFLAMRPYSTGVYVLVENLSTGKTEFGTISGGVYNEIINVTDEGVNPYAKVFTSLDYPAALICDQGDDPGTSQARLLLLDTDHPEDGFAEFSGSTKLRSCNHLQVKKLSSINHAIIYLFTQEPGDTSSQMSFIDLTANPITAPYFVIE